MSPNYAKGHYSRAFLQVVRCQTVATRADIDLAMGLSPLDPMLAPMRTIKALSFGIDGDYATAADLAVLAARTATSHFRIVMSAVALCQLDGRTEAAARWARVVSEIRLDPSITQYLKSMPYTDADFSNKIRSALRAAGLPD